MAIYHCCAQVISASKGRSAVNAAAYRSGTILRSDYYGETFDYTRKGGVIYSEIMLCENAPKAYGERATLWNTVIFHVKCIKFFQI